MSNLSVKNVPAKTMAYLKRRAKDNHRSLQGEVLHILEEVSEPARKTSLREIWETARDQGLGKGPRSVDIIRELRDSR